jgi:hypothetical protein
VTGRFKGGNADTPTDVNHMITNRRAVELDFFNQGRLPGPVAEPVTEPAARVNLAESNHPADARVLKILPVKGQDHVEAVAIYIRHVVRADSSMNDLPVVLGRPRRGPDSSRRNPRRVNSRWQQRND